MARFTQTIALPAPPASVFDYLADQSNLVDWHPAIVSSERTGDEPVGAGTVTDAVFVFYTRDIELAYEIVEHRPPGHLVAEARSRRARARDEFTVVATDDGSEVTWTSELVLGGLLRLFDRGLQVAFDGIGERAAKGLTGALG